MHALKIYYCVPHCLVVCESEPPVFVYTYHNQNIMNGAQERQRNYYRVTETNLKAMIMRNMFGDECAEKRNIKRIKRQ